MKSMYRFSIIFLLIMLMGAVNWSCSNNDRNANETDLEADYCCPHCRILIQPYGDFSQARAKEVSRQLVHALDEHVAELAVTDVVILPNKPLTDDLLNDAKTRYRAQKILDQQRGTRKERNDVVIGLTDKDISTSIHGQEDFGILGLTYVGMNNSVISTFRVSDKSQFWKVVLHEFGHGYLGLHHCPNNDKSCFMVDAQGKPNLAPQRHFCDSCARL